MSQEDFPCGLADKESASNAETRVQPLCWEDPLEKGKAPDSSILAWRIPWTVEKSWTRLSDFHFQAALGTFPMAQLYGIHPHCRRCRFDPWTRKIPWRRK